MGCTTSSPETLIKTHQKGSVSSGTPSPVLEPQRISMMATASSSFSQGSRPSPNLRISPGLKNSPDSRPSPGIKINGYLSPEIRAAKTPAKNKAFSFDNDLIELDDILSEGYNVLQLLGKGSSASVYKVSCKKTGEIRAFKRLHPNTEDPTRMEREQKLLIQEGEMLARLSHPNLVKVYELIETSDEIILSMEYCEGGRLFDALKAARSLASEEIICRIMYELLDVIAYLHKRNIMHRDVKIENILLENGDLKSGSLKLIDLGISIEMGERTSFTRVMGTTCYMAPELLLGNYNEKVDEWACGVIMYILLTGTMPFKGKDFDEIKENVISKQLDFSHPFLANKSAGCLELLKGLLQRNPVKRLTAAEALKTDWLQKSIYQNSPGFSNLDNYKLEGIKIEDQKTKGLLEMLMIRALGSKTLDRADAAKTFAKIQRSQQTLTFEDLIFGIVKKGLSERTISLGDLKLQIDTELKIINIDITIFFEMFCKVVLGGDIKLKGMLMGYMSSRKISKEVSGQLEISLVETIGIKAEVYKGALLKCTNKLTFERFFSLLQQIFPQE